MKKKLLTLSLYLLSINCYADNKPLTYEQGTLCYKNEHIYASCTLENNKIVSFCGNKIPEKLTNQSNIYSYDSPLSYDEGYVQYRYGTYNKIENLYPKEEKPPKNTFFYKRYASSPENEVIGFRTDRYDGYEYEFYKNINGKINFGLTITRIIELPMLSRKTIILDETCKKDKFIYISSLWERRFSKGIQ